MATKTAKKAAAKKAAPAAKAKPRAKKVPAIPPGYEGVTPYLVVSGAAKALAFYAKAFGAKELVRMSGPGGKVMHAEVEIAGRARLMLADEFPEMGAVSPKTLKGTATGLLVYVPDVDALVKRAVAAGAKVVKPVADQFYGDRSGLLMDPFGHKWSFATHVEDVSPAEMKKRMAAFANAT